MKKVTIDQFRAQEKPTRGSKLDPFRDEILELNQEGYSLNQVIEFLVLNDVQVARSTLHGFIKRSARVVFNKIELTERQKQDKAKLEREGESNKVEYFRQFTPPGWADPAIDINKLIE